MKEEKLEEAKRLYETANADQKYVLESLFTELAGSEDERIRKEIVRFIRMEVEDEIVGNKWLAWLEKQGEQKPAVEMKTPEESLGIDSETYSKIMDECIYGDCEQNPAWSEDDDDDAWMNDIISKVENNLQLNKAEIDWLKSLRPQSKQEWNEEDRKMINKLSSVVVLYYNICDDDLDKQSCIDWLKSLKERYTWKPSDEQIEILDMVLTNESLDDNIARILRELREQLKKLRENKIWKC